jgi:outer membrane protein assembly factor BamB
MKARVDANSVDVGTANQWYRAALWSAVVAAAFSMIVVGLLIVNYLQIEVYDPIRAERLELLKLKFLDQPDDKLLLLQIRELDLKIRQDRIRRNKFSYKGSFLLLGGLAVFVISAKLAVSFKKKLPEPKAHPDRQSEQVRQAIRARWAVTVGLAALGAAVLFFATRPVVDFGEELSQKQVWPRFRGPGGLGISASTNVPDNWNGGTNKGILWKSKVPLPGHNSPIVWGDRVFLSGADANERQVYCFEALSGKLLWTGNVPDLAANGAEPVEPGEGTGFAAPTMVTDGRRVYAIFATGDVGCFDFYGRAVWARNLGTPDSSYGYASSLAMFRELLLVQYDQGGFEDEKSKLIALDGLLGHTVWETKRPVPNTWTSPIIIEFGSQHQIITCGDPWVIAYDANDPNGAELWRADCLGTDVAPSPIYAGGLIFGIEPYIKLVAIRPDGRGDVTKTHIAWSNEEGAPDICSPVSNGELIFLLTTDGLLNCHKVKDGKKLWEKDLREDFISSPTLVGDNLYLLSQKGVMFIIEVGTAHKELARCELGEDCHASPAFVDGHIYIRGTKNLYCIGK